MLKIMKANLIFNCLLIVGLALMLDCVQQNSKYPSNMPEDFNFIAEIKSNTFVVDTYKNTLTKSIDWDKDTVISFEFPQYEKVKVFNILKEINILNYPKNFSPKSTIRIFPGFLYRFKFTMKSIEYEVDWKVNTESEVPDAKELKKLFEDIMLYIEKDQRVKNLPESKRVFM
jgi:hypothetical protein